MESRTLGRKIGTINVVVLKARILPNKQGLRKQCSYCVLELNGETRRINVVNDVGDYIEWNEELQFPIYEGANDEKVITLSCHAEDPVQPTLIGERNVSLNNAFLSGKSDGWFGLMRKNRHVGEIYLKITFRLEETPITEPILPSMQFPKSELASSGEYLTNTSLEGILSVHPRVRIQSVKTPEAGPSKTDVVASIPLRLPTRDAHLINIPEPYRPVGGGGYCDLFRGIYISIGAALAMKRPRFSTLCPSEVADAKRRFAREANTWSSLVHDKILLFHGMVEISNEIYLVSPWIEYGDLSKFVIERLKFMSASPSHQREHPRRIAYEAFKASTSIYGIASGLAYLHAANIIHGDMKALNVLLTEQLEPLICDFGMAKVLDGYNETSTTMKGAGSYRFMSPELMCDGPKTTESDIYAFGMTIVEILTGHIPLHGPNQVPFIRAILSGQRPPCEPIFRQGVGFGTLWVIASAYWASEPSERPSAGRVLEWMERMMETDIR